MKKPWVCHRGKVTDTIEKSAGKLGSPTKLISVGDVTYLTPARLLDKIRRILDGHKNS